jgi:hypothetical protein
VRWFVLSNRAIIVHRYVHVMSTTCISAFSVWCWTAEWVSPGSYLALSGEGKCKQSCEVRWDPNCRAPFFRRQLRLASACSIASANPLSKLHQEMTNWWYSAAETCDNQVQGAAALFRYPNKSLRECHWQGVSSSIEIEVPA